jgi:hypothetical protein
MPEGSGNGWRWGGKSKKDPKQNDKNLLWDELNIRKTELNVKQKKTTRYGGVLFS